MSWSSYIDNLLTSGHVKKAAICGHDGSLWAASADYNISVEEAKSLLLAFKDTTAYTQSGMHVGGVRYIFLSGTDQILRGKKGTAGVHVAKTGQAILIGFYDDPTTPNQCAIQVENMAEYLKGMNY
ncbi:Profilin [Chionoecetes opilio]|uniref:Profilin n=1 Tax=Chionoecetes opilio TaxID=41210 RepID=A0A8J4Y743_CHIOP|nr:Profilin [Chionoecetes opilio]